MKNLEERVQAMNEAIDIYNIKTNSAADSIQTLYNTLLDEYEETGDMNYKAYSEWKEKIFRDSRMKNSQQQLHNLLDESNSQILWYHDTTTGKHHKIYELVTDRNMDIDELLNFADLTIKDVEEMIGFEIDYENFTFENPESDC